MQYAISFSECSFNILCLILFCHDGLINCKKDLREEVDLHFIIFWLAIFWAPTFYPSISSLMNSILDPGLFGVAAGCKNQFQLILCFSGLVISWIKPFQQFYANFTSLFLCWLGYLLPRAFKWSQEIISVKSSHFSNMLRFCRMEKLNCKQKDFSSEDYILDWVWMRDIAWFEVWKLVLNHWHRVTIWQIWRRDYCAVESTLDWWKPLKLK